MVKRYGKQKTKAVRNRKKHRLLTKNIRDDVSIIAIAKKVLNNESTVQEEARNGVNVELRIKTWKTTTIKS